MQKVIDYLEQYVEWVAVALGGMFLLWMAYAYVAQPPVVETLPDGKVLTPGEIDRYILSEAGEELERAMKNTQVPAWTVKNYAETFRKAIMGEGMSPTVFASGRWIGNPFVPKYHWDNENGPGIKLPAQEQIAGLPKLPKATVKVDAQGRPLPPSQGISTVWLPDPQAEVAPNKAIAPVKQDRIWATAAWTIDMKELAAEFIRLKIPADRWTTAFVQVEFIRQEQFRDGTLGPETVVAPLVIHRLQPLPADGDNAGQRLFLEWAQRNTHEITNPSFYQVFGGDLWWAPGTPDPNVVVKQVLLPIPPVPAPVPNPRPGVRPPVMPRVTPPPRTTPAPRPTPARTTPTPPPSFTTGGGAPGFTMPPGMTPAAPMGPMGGWDPNTTGDPNMMGGGSMMMPMAPSFAGGAAAPGAPVQGYTPPPVGNFNPSQLGKVDLWIHDDTAGDGKVYHYKLRYKLRNPLAESNQIDPKLAAQFALTSPDSDWTDYITMRSDKHFFIQGGLYGGTVRFDIFKWQDGIWERQNAVVTPGDMIGTKDKLADFSTGWALVDIRVDSRSSDAKVILADAEGNIGGRERKTDSNSKLYEQLRQKAQEALDARNAAAASAAGAAAGTVPGGR